MTNTYHILRVHRSFIDLRELLLVFMGLKMKRNFCLFRIFVILSNLIKKSPKNLAWNFFNSTLHYFIYIQPYTLTTSIIILVPMFFNSYFTVVKKISNINIIELRDSFYNLVWLWCVIEPTCSFDNPIWLWCIIELRDSFYNPLWSWCVSMSMLTMELDTCPLQKK